MRQFRTNRAATDHNGTFLFVISIALALSLGAGLMLFGGVVLMIEQPATPLF